MEEQINPVLLRFLEADSAEEKSELLKNQDLEVTDRLIDDLAASMDLVIPDGSTEERFQKLKNAVSTRAKYELERSRKC
ncbi:MAG: hypothetical protein IJJ13_05585 [Lachnospiraceae bacterium]|nr:hypothetical protein [Lachnospiraceae bacterium]